MSVERLNQDIERVLEKIATSQERLTFTEKSLDEAEKDLKQLTGEKPSRLNEAEALYRNARTQNRALYSLLGAASQTLDRYLRPLVSPATVKDRPKEPDASKSQEKDDKVPRFAQQCLDESRTNTIFTQEGVNAPPRIFTTDPEVSRGPIREMTEQEGLKELQSFLAAYIENGTDEGLKQTAHSLQQSLNFIGEKEMAAATTEMAQRWKEYLDKDKNHQLLIVRGSGAQSWQPTKSDAYVIDRALSNIDLPDYKGRLLVDREHLTAAPQDTKVVYVDDWTVSGGQLNDAHAHFVNQDVLSELPRRAESNLIIASPLLQKKGFTAEETEISYVEPHEIIPVRASFTAVPRMHLAYSQQNDRITPVHVAGSHSSVDFGFGNVVASMAKELNARHPGEIQTPGLIDIVKPYSENEIPSHIARLREINES